MIYKYLNAGCGYDLKPSEDGWLNVDTEYRGNGQENFRIWDITTPPDSDDPERDFVERFEFILVNHVLCTMNEHMVHKALINLHRALKPGGRVQVIDMDLLKVFAAYQEERIEDIPIQEGDIDDRLCRAISGYGTRLSLFTEQRMKNVLEEAGFRTTIRIAGHPFDTRPKESLVFEAYK